MSSDLHSCFSRFCSCFIFFLDNFTGHKGVSLCVFKMVHGWSFSCASAVYTDGNESQVFRNICYRRCRNGCQIIRQGLKLTVVIDQFLALFFHSPHCIGEDTEVSLRWHNLSTPRVQCLGLGGSRCTAAGVDLQVRARGAAGQVWRWRGSRAVSTGVKH